MAESKMNNPLRILRTLDGFLNKEAEVILFGRAALVLGFPNSPEGYGSTLDVDAIIPSKEMESLQQNEQFWGAIAATNDTLESDGLYMTHLFEETQTILTPDWLKKTVDINLDGMRHLKIRRPSTTDLILTKMTRGLDPQDLADINFLLTQEHISPAHLQDAMGAAMFPELQEIRDLFELAKPVVLKLAQDNQDLRKTQRCTPLVGLAAPKAIHPREGTPRKYGE